MSFISSTIQAFEGAPLPDAMRRAAIDFLVANARRQLNAAPPDAEAVFAREMAARPIAEHVQAANEQHYELPAAFFEKPMASKRARLAGGAMNGPWGAFVAM